jgi:predicted nucleic acid-binding protein
MKTTVSTKGQLIPPAEIRKRDNIEPRLRWAKLLAELRKSGESMPIKDSLMAATALVHDFIVVTRNTNDFRKAHVKVLDPFAWTGQSSESS